jgi:hypothetical protein
MVSPVSEGPFELTEPTGPRVRVEGGLVYVRLELSRQHETRGRWDIEIVLDSETAHELGTELVEKANKIP